MKAGGVLSRSLIHISDPTIGRGVELEGMLFEKVGGDIDFILFEKERESAKEFTRRCFAGCDAIVFIGAAGIAVRMIAPLVKAKDTDPAVLVIDEKGRFVIPILSGHIGGANALAMRLATLLHATPVITTATDVNGVFAVDVWATQNGCAIPDTQHIKAVSAALLVGQSVGVQSYFGICGTLPMGVLADISKNHLSARLQSFPKS